MNLHTWAIEWKYTLIPEFETQAMAQMAPWELTALAHFDILGETKFWIDPRVFLSGVPQTLLICRHPSSRFV